MYRQAFDFLAHFQTDKSYQEIEERASQRKLEIYTMRRFMLKKDDTEKNQIDLVIGFANIKEDKIPEAVDRCIKFFDKGISPSTF